MSTRDPVELAWWSLATPTRLLVRLGHWLIGATPAGIAITLWATATAVDLATSDNAWLVGWAVAYAAVMAINLQMFLSTPAPATGPKADRAHWLIKVIWSVLWIWGLFLFAVTLSPEVLSYPLMAVAVAASLSGDDADGEPVLHRVVRAVRTAATALMPSGVRS